MSESPSSAASSSALTLFDSYTRSLVPFVPLVPGEVGLYTCGPTVYDRQHIGNHRTFLFEDVLKRTLRWFGYRVRHVTNVTDVGHLTSDADTGDDKMEKRAAAVGDSAWAIARRYTEAFERDTALLGMDPPDVLCRATDHLPEQIAYIRELEARGFTYATDDGIYFDTSRLEDYGRLGRLDEAGLAGGKRVELGQKRRITDFALWKHSPTGSGTRRQMEWESPWGTGFPGWHIECSAMAQKYLGDLFDIHCGGEDHLTVHHPNEIAQAQGRTGSRLARFWMHGYFLMMTDPREGALPDAPDGAGVKMARSRTFITLDELAARGHEPLAFRYLTLTAHYRARMTFSWASLDGASAALGRLRRAVAELPAGGTADARWLLRFGDAIGADLAMPRALSLAHDVLRADLAPADRRATLLRFDDVLGLALGRAPDPSADDAPASVRALAEQRRDARARRDFAEADRLRRAIADAGFVVADEGAGFSLRRA